MKSKNGIRGLTQENIKRGLQVILYAPAIEASSYFVAKRKNITAESARMKNKQRENMAP